MREIALKKRVGAWFGKRPLVASGRIFDARAGVPWWRRLLLPADFASQAVICQEENLECRKIVTEYLSIRESRHTATLKVAEARDYPRPPDDHPREFKNQRFTYIDNEENLKCHRCKGKGRIDCSPDVPCPSCKGRRTRNDFCFTCGGSGRAGQDQKEQCWACGGRGTRSEDCAACAGLYSGSTGRVKCNRCGGAGWAVCRTCAGAGERVRARLTTRRYTCSTESHFRLGSLGTDRLNNGLSPRHFESLPGNLLGQEFQPPSSDSVVLQRLGVYTFAVESRTCRYRKTEFCVNRISTSHGVKFVHRRLPWSIPRLISAGVISTLVICLLAAFPLAL